ncbi:uncharacterized protein [Macrobrachium rosenbergii]|uniref:uncharacterized protein n=1 Tax=Macrobrachium rosenbergii TaxID=79674 RepID=UPI0034D55B46
MREVKVYILLLGLSFTAVCSQQDAKPPRILEGEQLLANGTVTLTCVGDEPLVWTYKYQDCQVEMRNQPRTLKTDDKYQSKLELSGINSQGHYHCHYENTSLSDPGASASTYVYLFSDEEDFAEPDLGPCQNHKETGHVGGQVVLDCRPTQPNLTVVVEHGGKEIHRGPLEDPRAGYELRNLTEDSKGQYKCYIFSGYIYKNGNKSIEVEGTAFILEFKGPLKPPRLNIAKNTFPVVGYDMKLFCQILDNKFQSQPTLPGLCPME